MEVLYPNGVAFVFPIGGRLAPRRICRTVSRPGSIPSRSEEFGEMGVVGVRVPLRMELEDMLLNHD